MFPGAPSPAERASAELVRAVELELAELGYVLSSRLSARLLLLSPDELAQRLSWLRQTLAAHLGADRRHVPLFYRFPEGVPTDTRALWWSKVLVHYLQAPEQPCLFCRRTGTTHVLAPCQHVVCEHCFDGGNYTACPVCEHHVDLHSPFFRLADVPEQQRPPTEPVRFKLLDLGGDLEALALALVTSLCERPQALSPDDRDVLTELVTGYGDAALAALPAVIPVKEVVALVFAALARKGDPERVLDVARPHLKTATDVLRFLAALSGEDPSLQGQQLLGRGPAGEQVFKTIRRFRMAKLSRRLRRGLLGLLEALDAERRTEDMLRHRSYWVWAGQFLHPHEYARRFPQVAESFAVVRKRAPDGTRAPPFRSYASRVEVAFARQDTPGLFALLSERPGELGRRFDRVLRTVATEPDAVETLLGAFEAHLPALSTPMLLGLRAYLPTRMERAPVRIFWPKGAVARGVMAADARPVLPGAAVTRAVGSIERELLRRFADKPGVDDVWVDERLRDIPVPFNERTATRSAISLPRGSRLSVAEGKIARLFLHWCQPPGSPEHTDLDLSVAFYDTDWGYLGVCSFTQLRFNQTDSQWVATSSGDLRNAPFPEGATEFIDLHQPLARQSGIRYAVMVVNAYAGLPFSELERGFAGVMLREDPEGAHFDPRTVELKFALQGEHGVYLPLVFDLQARALHWLDLHARGEFEFNHVEQSQKAISELCPRMIGYFDSGIRPSMYELALLHAAARGQRVFLRRTTGELRRLERGDDTAEHFLARLRSEAGLPAREADAGASGRTLLAALHAGDVELPGTSVRYCLLPQRTTGTIAASDLLA